MNKITLVVCGDVIHVYHSWDKSGISAQYERYQQAGKCPGSTSGIPSDRLHILLQRLRLGTSKIWVLDHRIPKLPNE